MITREKLAKKIVDYLHHHITLEELVDWAEKAMMEEELEAQDYETLREIISRLGLADVKAFGLSWGTLENFLSRLGYQVSIRVLERA